MDKLTVIREQLQRMRQMNRYYHQQFLIDVRFLFAASILLIVIQENIVFYIIPFVCLFGAVILSFHAHYLIFSRNFSQYLEKKINLETGDELLIAHQLENRYFFPIQDRKIVVAGFGKSFSWFGFVTLFITSYGIGLFVYGILNVNLLDSIIYTITLTSSTLLTVAIGFWWFIRGEGEKRLKDVYGQYE